MVLPYEADDVINPLAHPSFHVHHHQQWVLAKRGTVRGSPGPLQDSGLESTIKGAAT